MKAPAGALALCLAGCAVAGSVAAGGFVSRDYDVVRVDPVPHDRCGPIKEWSLKEKCADYKDQAFTYVHGLATTDEVCLERGFGEVAGPACTARGTVMDVGSDFWDIRIDEVKAESKLKAYDGKVLRFPQSKLVDMYLGQKGF